MRKKVVPKSPYLRPEYLYGSKRTEKDREKNLEHVASASGVNVCIGAPGKKKEEIRTTEQQKTKPHHTFLSLKFVSKPSNNYTISLLPEIRDP
jgi:hypothetical protein